MTSIDDLRATLDLHAGDPTESGIGTVARTAAVRDRVTVELAASDLPRLVSWGTSGDDDRVTIGGPAVQGSLAYDVDDFSDFYYVDPGNGEELTVRSVTGRPGIAIYTLGDGRPAGLTTGGVTYREAPAGLELLGADVSEPGDSELGGAGCGHEPGDPGLPRLRRWSLVAGAARRHRRPGSGLRRRLRSAADRRRERRWLRHADRAGRGRDRQPTPLPGPASAPGRSISAAT